MLGLIHDCLKHREYREEESILSNEYNTEICVFSVDWTTLTKNVLKMTNDRCIKMYIKIIWSRIFNICIKIIYDFYVINSFAEHLAEMSLIEGIGDEVTHFFMGLFVIIVGKF